ncbi:MAG: hypothetical protein ACQSGP_10450 [Frankia sp.]
MSPVTLRTPDDAVEPELAPEDALGVGEAPELELPEPEVPEPDPALGAACGVVEDPLSAECVALAPPDSAFAATTTATAPRIAANPSWARREGERGGRLSLIGG